MKDETLNKNARIGSTDEFVDFFHQKIQLKLNELRKDKHSVRNKLIREIKIIAVLLLVFLFGGSYVTGEPIYIMMMVSSVIFAGICVFTLPRHYRKWNRSLTDAIMPEVCEYIDHLNYDTDGTPKDFYRPFQEVGMFGNVNGAGYQHYLTGHYRGTGFSLTNADLTSSSRSSKSTVFYGILFQIECPMYAHQPILIRSGPQRLLPRIFSPHKNLPKTHVTTGRNDFDDTFTVYCDDNELAKRFITERFMDTLLWIHNEYTDQFAHRDLLCGFMENTYYMALQRYEKSFSWGPIRFEKPVGLLDSGPLLLSDEAISSRVRRLLEDIAMAYRIIDRFTETDGHQEIRTAGTIH